MKIPKPKQHEDFYLTELRRYTVTIEVEVTGFAEETSDVDICSKAITRFRDGSLDGDSQVVSSEKIKDVELDFKTDMPFRRGDWLKAKMRSLGLNERGDPLRPWEKVRPDCETTLTEIPPKQSIFIRIIAHIGRWVKHALFL